MVARSDRDKEADGHWEDSHNHVAGQTPDPIKTDRSRAGLQQKDNRSLLQKLLSFRYQKPNQIIHRRHRQ